MNGNPNAILMVTPVGRIDVNEQAATATLVRNPHPVGVLYRELDARWYVYNLGLESMEVNVDFHVAINAESQPSQREQCLSVLGRVVDGVARRRGG